MRLASALFLAVAAAILSTWWWLGAPVAMPPSPLDPGEKLYCVSYAPFRGSQTPLDPTTRVDPRQIEEDFARLSRLTDCVRTYSTDLGIDQVPEIARRHGLKVMLGLWVHRDPARTQREIAIGVALAKRYPDVIRSIVVGNESLLRGEIAPDALANLIRDVKTQVAVPVTYADVWEFWLRAREVYDAVDFVTIHILPYWEDFPIPADVAGAHVAAIRRKVAEAFPGKEILIGEVGWPSAGRMRESALPSPANQARVIHDILAIAKREGFHVNVIEAFDQPWKEQQEGTAGGHWGFLDGLTREFKFDWGQAVSNYPTWQRHAGQGTALALLVFASALVARGRKPKPDRPECVSWLAVAAIALVSGTLIGWVIGNVPIESLGPGGWLRSLAMSGLAIAAPIACAAGVMRHASIPAFCRVVGARDVRPADPLVFVLGVLLVALTVIAVQVVLGLVFDPRYKDFPFAPLTAAATPFLALSWMGWRPAGRRGTAEIVASVVLAASAVYIAANEGVDNWQALWLCGACTAIAITLSRSRDVQSS
jgi:exo-beta-1,3-glucanase (GH17 family)